MSADKEIDARVRLGEQVAYPASRREAKLLFESARTATIYWCSACERPAVWFTGPLVCSNCGAPRDGAEPALTMGRLVLRFDSVPVPANPWYYDPAADPLRFK